MLLSSVKTKVSLRIPSGEFQKYSSYTYLAFLEIGLSHFRQHRLSSKARMAYTSPARTKGSAEPKFLRKY